MDTDTSIGLWIFLLVGIAIGFFFLLYSILDFILYGSCILTLVLGFLFFYFLLWVSEQLGKGGEETFRSEGPHVSETEYQKEEKSRIDLSYFVNKLKGEKTCENCGTELVYKEEFDSYYCPECHEYK